MNDANQLIKAAKEFLHQAYVELELPGLEERLQQVQEEIIQSGTYIQLPQELEHGARMAWRNSNRCIGRLFWKSLVVRDYRLVSSPDEVASALYEHLTLATNGGKIIPMITIFAPEQQDRTVPIRIWNKHLIRYACYEEKNGILTGDPAQKDFTQYCSQIGWKGTGKAFDILPIVIQCNNEQPRWYPLTDEWVKEVEIEHPEHRWFKMLNLRWHAVPLISDMVLEIGGIRYPAAPFNGWYMVTEIGSRNLGDENRYNMLPIIAKKMGLSTDKTDPFWKDKALVVLNEAVYHSFKNSGVTLTDHHSASDQFMKFMRNEQQCQRKVTGDWSWLVPPMSGSSLEVFHKEYDSRILSPNFFYNTTDVLSGTNNH